MSYLKSKKRRKTKIRKTRKQACSSRACSSRACSSRACSSQNGGSPYIVEKTINFDILPSFTNINLLNGNPYKNKPNYITRFDIENNIYELDSESGKKKPSFLGKINEGNHIVDNLFAELIVENNKKKYINYMPPKKLHKKIKVELKQLNLL